MLNMCKIQLCVDSDRFFLKFMSPNSKKLKKQLEILNYDVRLTDVDYLSASISFNYMNYDIVQISTT